MTGRVYRWLDRAGNWLLPPCCALCRGPGTVRGRDLCACCEADLPRLDGCCPRCGSPDAEATGPVGVTPGCRACRSRTLPYQRCCAPFPYAFPFDRLIPALKYEGALTDARVLGVLLAEAVASRGMQRGVDLIVPMPLHSARLIERGYNQAHEIARFAAAKLGVPIDERALQRTRATAPQVGLERDARRRNVRNAFAANPPRVAARRVALLDDVMTTGSTVAAAATALRDAGTAGVDVWCVARALA